MGWFSYQDTDQVIGDDTLDLTYSYLEQLSKKYSANLGRKITLEELQTLLCMSLDVSGEEFIEGLSEKSVSKVTVKTAKRRKKSLNI